MTDTTLFRNKVREKGIKYEFLANCLGLTPYGLARKIDNKSEFRASEIQVLMDVLRLSATERDQIFFA